MKDSRPKKRFILLWIGLLFVIPACLCYPASLAPLRQGSTPSPLPATQTPETPAATATPVPSPLPTATPVPTSLSVDDPVCTNDLEKLLQQSETDNYPGPSLRRAYTLVTYTVSGDTISDPQVISHIPERVRADQQDAVAQENIWRAFTNIIPADQRSQVSRFVIFTDGVGNSLGAVEQMDDPHEWMLEMDIEDASHFPILSTTLVHEFAHLLTMNETQMKTNFKEINLPGNSQTYEQAAAACATYYVFAGCARTDSYMNTFFQRFWPGIYTEWLAIDNEANQNTIDMKLELFYHKYSDQFVTQYAATSPEEDIAESFMYFVFQPQPSGATVAEQKYGFFYGYPELVSLRTEIRSSLCSITGTP